ncbi:MAG: inverse autotransporter beta domain-containing protein [Alphaproteobacteria bacterium]|nr:inverse autotransporter beta domain-containing protein [Alphaproteobacteria bacterium]
MAHRFSLLLTTALILPAPAMAQEALQPRAELNVRPGTERTITMTEFWIPLSQNERAVIYGDLRMMADSEDNKEGNVGVGYRQIVAAPVVGQGVAGAAIWFDHRITDYDSRFNQVTVGGEWLARDWDLRVNGYIPLSGDELHEVADGEGAGASFTGTGLVVQTNGTVLEESQGGVDAEIGWEVGGASAWVAEHTDALRVYGGGYYFDGDDTDPTAGWKTRVAADITSDIQIGARFQRDGERGSQGFLEATLRFPFGKKKSYRAEGLRARMDESPERDIDIVTGTEQIESGENIVVLNRATGLQQTILHVDNTAPGGGDGSAENPFNTLAAAQAASAAHDIIYLHRGDGTTAGQSTGFLMNKTGQQLIGSGVDFVYDAERFTTANGRAPQSALIAAAGADPVITNTNLAGNGITVTANNVKIAGVTVDGATQTGIFGNFAVPGDFTFAMDDVTSINNGVRGSDIRTFGGANLDLSVTASTFSDNVQQGLYVFLQGNGTGTILIEDNTMNGNGNDGYRSSSRDSFAQTTTFRGNIAETNGQSGFALRSEGTGMDVFTVTDNEATGNTTYGFLLRQLTGGLTVNFSRNIATGNTIHGAYLDDDEAGQNMIVDFGGGTLGSEGNNSIHTNGGTDIRVDIDGDQLKAENNWWGNAAGLVAGERTLDAASTIDSTPALTQAP